MFAATEDVILPATVTGSWPRPAWFTGKLGAEAVSTRLTDVKYREQFLDALATVISDQERAGLDIIVNGDYHHDDDLGGLSWMLFNALRMTGFDAEHSKGVEFGQYPSATLLNEVLGSYRLPAVVGEPGVRIPFEFDTIWRAAQAKTDKPVKFGAISAQTLALAANIQGSPYDDDRRQLTWDLAEIFNGQLRELARAGCKVIQIEEPVIHYAYLLGAPAEHVDFMIDALNREMEGLEDCEVWVHTCWGNPNMQRLFDKTSYASSLENYLYRVNCDVLTVEMCDRDFEDIELFGQFRDVEKKVAVGIVSHRTLQADSSEEIAANIRKCLEYIPPERLALSSDCGFGRQGFNRLVAYHKAAAIVRGANTVRGELGFEVTETRNDDPSTKLTGAGNTP